MNLYARICVGILRFNTITTTRLHKLYRFFSTDAIPLYSAQKGIYGNLHRIVGDARESYICIYVYTYICIYNARRPIYMCDMVSHLNFPRSKGSHYMDRNSRGIYAAKFWYIYDEFSWIYRQRISSGPPVQRNKGYPYGTKDNKRTAPFGTVLCNH